MPLNRLGPMGRYVLCFVCLHSLFAQKPVVTAIGMAGQERLELFQIPGANPAAVRILVLPGSEGTGMETLIRGEIVSFQNNPKLRKRISLEAIPKLGSFIQLRLPPEGDAYRENSAAHAVWRWIGATGPDVVVVVGEDQAGIVPALNAKAGANGGIVWATKVEAKAGFLARIKLPGGRSSARVEHQSRLDRNPAGLARQLSAFYGKDLPEPVYIPAFALIARLRQGDVPDVERIALPYVNGERDSLAKLTASHLSGHLLFAELSEKTANPAYVRLVRAAADLGFEADGTPRDSMPLHNRMSDSVFMGCPILAKAGKLTGESRYFDMALRHYRFMRRLDLRPDGLWRHSPLDEAPWGRGNAFALLGLALTLSDFPPGHAGFDEMLSDFRAHAAALVRYQASDGMWHQVIDDSGSYRELSATAMIGAALTRGLRRGWLDRTAYQKYVDLAWEGVKARSGSDGALIDVCESTGAQKSKQDYLNRKAILGRDARGGAMVMFFATEIAYGQ